MSSAAEAEDGIGPNVAELAGLSLEEKVKRARELLKKPRVPTASKKGGGKKGGGGGGGGGGGHAHGSSHG